MKYEISFPHPHTHLLHVSLHFQADRDLTLLKMPVWTPGSYKVREFPKNVQDLLIQTKNGGSVSFEQIRKHTWEIQTVPGKEYVVYYKVYAHELTVRTSHADATHVMINGASVFMFIEGKQQELVSIKFHFPETWEVSTTLKQENDLFIASNLDELIDSPIELRPNLEHHHFTVMNIPHELVLWGGPGNYSPQKIIHDLVKIIVENASVFDNQLPYDQYIFFVLLTGSGGGGLEHKKSNVSMFPRLSFMPDEKYYRFLLLEAHEHFHVWNVKRIFPDSLTPFKYTEEQYVKNLWLHEGFTGYYDNIIPVRAGVVPVPYYLKTLGKTIKSFESKPGKTHQSLIESSFNAWIKLYLPDENTNNSSISYYEKGELVAFLLDTEIRKRTSDKSLDDVMRYLWENFGKTETPYPESDILSLMEEATNLDLHEFYKNFIQGTAPLPYNEALGVVGLQLVTEIPTQEPPFLGISLKPETTTVSFVAEDSPAQRAGIYPGDELIAIQENKITSSSFKEILKKFQPNQEVKIHLFRRNKLEQVNVLLDPPFPNYSVKPVKDPTPQQLESFKKWLKQEYPRHHQEK